MSLFHRHPKSTHDDIPPENAVDYDVQRDTAAASTEGESPIDGFTPYAGILAPEHGVAAYDIEADTGITP